MKKAKTVRMEPGDVQLEVSRSGSFTLTFNEWRGDAMLTVAVRLDDCFLGTLAEYAGKVAAKRISNAQALKAGIEAGFHAAVAR